MKQYLQIALDHSIQTLESIHEQIHQCDLDWVLSFSACNRREMHELTRIRMDRIRDACLLSTIAISIKNKLKTL